MPSRRTYLLATLALLVGTTSLAGDSHAQIGYQAPMLPPTLGESPMMDPLAGSAATPELTDEQRLSPTASSNPMLWQQYQALQTGTSVAASDGCQSCSGCGVSDYNRCGCNTSVFPWHNGPGNCDVWCVGPKWAVDAGFLFMFRDDVNWAPVEADPNAGNGVPAAITDQFEHGPGGRVFVTGFNDSGFGMQVGYEGINDWDASLEFPVVPGGALPDTIRNINYQSRLNSVEINFFPNTPRVWKLFSGIRYVQLDEDFINTNAEVRPFPSPILAPPVTSDFTDTSVNYLLENRMLGFQLGGRRDAWQWGDRFLVNAFANAGVYCNKLRREDVNLTATTVITGDDLTTPDVNEFSRVTTTSQDTVRRDYTDVAFVGEAGLSGTWRINHCTAVQAGYQILALDGVSQGIDTFLNPTAGLNNSTVFFHGLQFGLEYRR